MVKKKLAKKILIVGGTGFIGSALAIKSKNKGFDITILAFSKRKELDKDYSYIFVDLKDKNKLKKSLRNKSFHYVINASGYIDHGDMNQNGEIIIYNHFIGLLNLVSCLDKKKLKCFINIGSSDEYGDNKSPQKETYRENPFSPYSFSKLASNYFLKMMNQSNNFPVSIIRFFLVYGPNQKTNRLIPYVIKNSLLNKKYFVSKGNQIRNFLYIDDATDAIFAVIQRSKHNGEIYNIGSSKNYKVNDIIKKINKIIPGGKKILTNTKKRKNENLSLYPCLKKTNKIIKWKEKINADDGLQKTIKFYRSYYERQR